MKSVKSSTTRASLAAMIALAISGGVQAQDSPLYGGFNIGESHGEVAQRDIAAQMAQRGFTTNSFSGDDKDVALKIFGGYRLNPTFALELGYYDLGNFGFNAALQPQASLGGTAKVRGIGLDLVGFLPLSETISLFGRAGVAHSNLQESFTSIGIGQPLGRTDDRDTDFKYGAGFQFDLSENFAIRTEVERYHLKEAFGIRDQVDMISVGAVFRFGGRTPAAAAPAPAPAVVAAPRQAAAPTPAPAPAPAPAPVRVTLSADSLFDFDSAVLRPAGRQELDALVTDLRGTNYDVITVTGYTDRLGAADYNLNLSRQRAEAVKAYLVTTGGLPAARITTRGENGSNPVTTPNQCANLARPAMITCLQPDRRVEVEVTATR